MKINWTVTSAIIGIVSGIATHLSFTTWEITLPVGFIAFIIALFFNPKKRYFRAFSLVLALIAGLNKFFFEFSGNLFGIDFTVGSGKVSNAVTIALVALAGLCLVLDYLERKEKLKGTFLDLSININKVGNVKGENININQTINKK